MPVVAAEGATGQAHLHDVVELTVAGEDLHLAVMKQVIGAADSGGNFVHESEMNGWETVRIIGGLVFFVETYAEIQSEPFAHRPGILEVKSVCSLLISASVIHAVPHDIVTKLALTPGGGRVRSSAKGRIRRILCDDRVADRGAGHW